MQISIINVDNQTQMNKAGKPYQILEVTFKNLTFDKTESKKLFSFGAQKAAYDALVTASHGDIFDISVVKNDKGYNDWVSVNQTTADQVGKSPNSTGGKTGGTPAPRSNYETPEERAKKQIYIVRQSAIGYAIGTLTPGAKAPLSSEDVLKVAKIYEDFVFDNEPDGTNDIPTLANMEDDIV